ncbi:unnamed protein product [Phytophthora lilii]|uniref:Unnamed protein product n=1 Tax=Phytophthora lilii TaxID=2077276 RepID=A0A9W6TE68_9STRA|nr:unnamed protein product [Phytophthora lilii]
MSLTFQHSTALMKNLEATYAKGAVLENDKEIHDLLKYCSAEIKQSIQSRSLARANPILAGLMMLSHHFQYLNLGGEVIMVTSRFRAFGHLYNALVEQGFLQHIPFFDEVLDIYDQMIFTPVTPGETRQYRVNRALEDAVMLDLIPLMDCLQRDGSLNLSALPIGKRVVQVAKLDGGAVRTMCRKVAVFETAMESLFAMWQRIAIRCYQKQICNSVFDLREKYFTFPAKPDFVNQEFGTVSFKTRTNRRNREDVFCKLMDLLEESDGPLSEHDLKKLKTEIRKDPELLNMISLRSLTWMSPNDFDPRNLANAPRDD